MNIWNSDEKYIKELFFIIKFLIAVDFLLLIKLTQFLGYLFMLNHNKKKGSNYSPDSILLHAGHSTPASTLHSIISGLCPWVHSHKPKDRKVQ